MAFDFSNGITLNPKQMEYIRNANKRYNFKLGATRSGKTFMDIVYVIASRIRERLGLSGLVVILGVTKSTIERNVLEPMRDIFGKELVGEIGSDNKAVLFGEECYCLGMEKANQIKKLRGASFKYVYADEVAEWSEEIWSLIPSRLDQTYSCLDGTMNPEDTNHWFKKWADGMVSKGGSIYLQTYTIFDNPKLDKTVVEELCREYEGTVFYDRYILGKWVNAEGLIYRVFANDNKKYEITPMEAHKKRFLYINIGHDFGGNLSNHAFVCTGITEDFELIALKSLSKPASGVDFNELFDTFVSFVNSCIDEWGISNYNGIKSINSVYCDSAEQTMINTYRKNTYFPIRNALKREINDRIRALTALIGKGKFFYVRGENDVLVDALNQASWSDKKDNTRLDNGTFNNDILDSLEYSFEKYIPYLVNFKVKERVVEEDDCENAS